MYVDLVAAIHQTPNPHMWRYPIGNASVCFLFTTTMSDELVLKSLLSTFLDDLHEIPSELDVSELSQKEVETHINRTTPALSGLRVVHDVFLTAVQMLWTQLQNRRTRSQGKTCLTPSRASSSMLASPRVLANKPTGPLQSSIGRQ